MGALAEDRHAIHAYFDGGLRLSCVKLLERNHLKEDVRSVGFHNLLFSPHVDALERVIKA